MSVDGQIDAKRIRAAGGSPLRLGVFLIDGTTGRQAEIELYRLTVEFRLFLEESCRWWDGRTDADTIGVKARPKEWWVEWLHQDRRVSALDHFRIKEDFPAWLKTLPGIERALARAFAEEDRGLGEIARHFGLKRDEMFAARDRLRESWERF